MHIYWLEQTTADVPAHDRWLSPVETTLLNGMRFEKRRSDWRLGRWTAKLAFASLRETPATTPALAKISISPASNGAPEGFLSGHPAAISLSLSHRDGRAICAASDARLPLGCDLEIVEPRSEAFIEDYFVLEEQTRIVSADGPERFLIAALHWSGKESALKALGVGLRLDTRSVVVRPVQGSFDAKCWRPLQVSCAEGKVFYGWWQSESRFVRTLVASTKTGPPIRLDLPDARQ